MMRTLVATSLVLVSLSCGGEVSQGPDAGARIDAAVPPRVDTRCDPSAPDLTAEEHALIDLPADSWWSAPDTHMPCPSEYPGCGHIMTAWSGGAFDANHNRVLIFGGGHADYAGNEVHAFNIGTLGWEQLTQPSPSSYESQDPLPDNQPVSRHSYDGLVYLAREDLLLAHGGSRWRDGSGTAVTWTMNAAAEWTNMQPANSFSLVNCCSEGSAYDEERGYAFYHVTHALMRYDPVQNEWSERHDLTYPPLWPRYEAWGDKVGTYDSARQRVWFLGADLYMVYDPAGDTFVTDEWITTGGGTYDNLDVVGGHTEQHIVTGGNEVIRARGPGVAYSKASDSIVAWFGGAPWILDLRTKSWSQGSAAGAPPAQADNGTFGRWRYIERVNAFVLVNGVDQDVYFYKHTDGCGAP